ncbi:MAG: c-type cytochrome domain-containing protein [Myxococcota bacterium]
MRASFVILVALAGCDDHIFGEQVVDPATMPQATGLEGVEQMVQTQCLGCHSKGQALGDLNLETDLVAATVDVIGSYNLPIVLPGDPENSMFYRKITNTQDGQGSDMPPGSGGLAAGVTDIVYDWIVSLEAPPE